MKEKTLWKDIEKCFKKSKGRFFSILCLIALGSFALVGLQIAGPDMRKTGEHYFSSLHAADLSIIGDYGIDEENQNAINQLSGTEKIEYGYLKDVVIRNSNTSIRVFSSTEALSAYEIVQGRLPEQEDEIALASFFSGEYSIGDHVVFTEKEDVAGDTALKNQEFTIVGFVNSSELLSIINMGQSTAGTGELQGYAVVTPDAFDYDVYMIARISFTDTLGLDPYSDAYTKRIQAHKDELNMDSDDVAEFLPVHYEAVTKVAGQNKDKQEIKLIVPADAKEFENYIQLVHRSNGKTISLLDDGCVISERLSKLLDVKPGDKVTITDTDAENHEQELTVSAITEMYTGHFLFMNQTYYQDVFSCDFTSNAALVTLSDRSADSTNQMASHFMELNGVKGVVQNTTMMNQINTIVQSLNRIMEILIMVAILLAVVILYNLTNINVSERIRELSTIKVLGFYHKEVTMYIYRETIILTLLGILVGFGFGDALFLYIISVVPPDEVMFSPALGWKAFVIPFAVVSIITLVLGFTVHRRLKHVDMLGALKSVE